MNKKLSTGSGSSDFNEKKKNLFDSRPKPRVKRFLLNNYIMKLLLEITIFSNF